MSAVSLRAGALAFALLLTALPQPVDARVAERGEINVTLQLGPGIKYGPLLGGSPAFGLVAAQGEVVLSPALGVVADVSLGLARTLPLRAHASGRLRLPAGPLPLSPFVQAGIGGGELFDVLGARLGYLALRLGAGVDYMLTRRWSAGLLVATDVGTTVGPRPALWGSVDLLLGATRTL